MSTPTRRHPPGGARPTYGHQAGLALLDVLLGMAIFSLIVVIGIQSVSQFRARAFQVSASSDAQQLSVGLESHFTDNGFYPAKADLAAFMASYGINLTRGVTVPGYARNNGEVQFCTTHKAGGTAPANITAWSIYDSRYGAVTSSGRGAATAPAFCTGGAPTWDGFAEATPGATPTVTATPTTAAPTPTPTPTPTPSPTTTTAAPAGVWRQASTSGGHTCAVRTNGALYCWGSNFYGQLGDGTTTHRPSPTRIGTFTDWVSVATGRWHTCGIRSTNGNALWCWGLNNWGQLGIGPASDQTRPAGIVGTGYTKVVLGMQHTCALSATGRVDCWGQGSHHANGNSSGASTDVPTSVVGDWPSNPFLDVSADELHTCAVRADRYMWCWGDNDSGQARETPSDVVASPSTYTTSGSHNWLTATTGMAHTCGLRQGGSIYCFGRNLEGQVGNYFTGTRGSGQVGGASTAVWTAVDAGNNHACAIQSDKSMWCWGAGNRGQLGRGNNNNQSAPAEVAHGSTWESVTAGGSWTGEPGGTSCGIRTSGDLYCWGQNVGDGTFDFRNNPTLVPTPTT